MPWPAGKKCDALSVAGREATRRSRMGSCRPRSGRGSPRFARAGAHSTSLLARCAEATLRASYFQGVRSGASVSRLNTVFIRLAAGMLLVLPAFGLLGAVVKRFEEQRLSRSFEPVLAEVVQ